MLRRCSLKVQMTFNGGNVVMPGGNPFSCLVYSVPILKLPEANPL